MKEEQQNRLKEKLRRELGPEIIAALASPEIIEIMLNPDGKIWFDYLGKGMADSGSFMSKAQAENLLGTIASINGTVITPSSPILEAELPFDGNRFTAITSPIVTNPSFTIRKRPGMIFSLTNYLEKGIITKQQVDSITQAILDKKNILVIGGTGSGKTTLVNAILNELSILAPNDRIVIIEDTIELKCSIPNTVELRTSNAVNITKALRTTLRMRPDRIIIGEIRGAEASTLLKAWNTGHPGGISTIHANSAASGLTRLEQLIHEAGIIPIPEVIAETINILIFIDRIKTKPWRKVKEVVLVKGYNKGRYVLEAI
jgi:type IV secretion system protein VirB11